MFDLLTARHRVLKEIQGIRHITAVAISFLSNGIMITFSLL
jgi:hypothetical protein